MTRKTKALYVAGVVVIFLIWGFWPQKFQSAMPDGFDPEEMLGVQVVLTAPDLETIDYTIPADDLAYAELLSLLDSRKYWTLLPTAGMGGRLITLDYTVLLAFYDGSGDYCVSFTGDQAMNLYNGNANRYFRTMGSETFQKDILDFLLDRKDLFPAN